MKESGENAKRTKGRRLKQWFRDQLIEKLEVHPEDVEFRSMGAGGEDLIIQHLKERSLLFVECKNQEKLNV